MTQEMTGKQPVLYSTLPPCKVNKLTVVSNQFTMIFG